MFKNTSSLQLWAGISAMSKALIYVIAFIFYGGVLAFPSINAEPEIFLSFLSNNYGLLSFLNLMSYVLFGILLAVLVLALHHRIKTKAANLIELASIFGVLWVGLVITSGMISNVGLDAVISLSIDNPTKAIQLYSTIATITEGIGGGNEIVGGLWVLLMSIAANRAKIFATSLNSLGIVVGLAGILTVYPSEIFEIVFGLTQIVWFFWIGIVLLKTP